MSIKGDLHEISLPTLVQLVIQEGGQALLQLTHTDGTVGRLYMDNSNLCHASLSPADAPDTAVQTGEAVVYELLSWHSGEFSVEKQVPPPVHTIEQSWSYLLMEGLRQLDEEQFVAEEQPQEESLADILSNLSQSDSAIIQELMAQQEQDNIFAGSIAHDFNNLLVALIAESEAALFKMSPDQPARKNLQRILQIAERSASLTRQLLAYSGEGQNQIVPFDFNKLVVENQEFLEAMLPKNIALKMNLEADLPFIEADAGQIQQVVMNLIINAAEAYQGRDGPVEIETQLVVIEPQGVWEEANQPVHPGKYVCLRVKDRGQGMDVATLARIFDPFFTTKVSGRGLGLAAVQGIIRNHRGAIHVTSQVGQGTTFHILLPASEARFFGEKVGTPKSHIQTGQILFIDDEEIVRCAIAEILELHGYRVLQAEDGNTGLALFRQHDNEISLVLLDMTMPLMTGDEVLQEIRYTHSDMPVLLLSGYDETKDMRQTAATRFLKKPFKMESLLTQVNELLS